MALRTTSEQSEHDLVIAKSASSFKDTGATVSVNPGNEKSLAIKGLYPDVIAKNPDGSIIIEEIQTESSVTEDECDRQWTPYSKSGYRFNFIVPSSRSGLALSFIRNKQLDVNLQSYEVSGDTVKFFDSRGNVIAQK